MDFTIKANTQAGNMTLLEYFAVAALPIAAESIRANPLMVGMNPRQDMVTLAFQIALAMVKESCVIDIQTQRDQS